jgi:hypothetical protein
MFTTDDSQDPFRELILVIRRLASAGSGQPALFPDVNVSATDLVRDFDQRLSVVREDSEDQLSSRQVESLNLLGQKLSTMSRDGAEFDADIWTDEAVRSSPDWAEVRTLAEAALDELKPVSGSES